MSYVMHMGLLRIRIDSVSTILMNSVCPTQCIRTVWYSGLIPYPLSEWIPYVLIIHAHFLKILINCISSTQMSSVNFFYNSDDSVRYTQALVKIPDKFRMLFSATYQTTPNKFCIFRLAVKVETRNWDTKARSQLDFPSHNDANSSTPKTQINIATDVPPLKSNHFWATNQTSNQDFDLKIEDRTFTNGNEIGVKVRSINR